MGALVAVVHLAIMLAFVRYRDLFRWDSTWFASIVESGYSNVTVKHQSNLGFFPGYPLLARAVHGLTGAPVPYALLATAQLMAVAFWTYFIRLTRCASRTLLVAAFPTAFFLMTGYSESTFLALAVGYVYWLVEGRRRSLFLAGLHGAALTATRAIGLPLCFAPVILHGRKGVPAALMSVSGIAAFFAYCHFAFGNWNAYGDAKRAGWNIRPDFLAPLKPATYALCTNRSWMTSDCLAASSIPLFAGFLVALTFRARRADAVGRLYLYIAWVTYLLPLVSVHASNGQGMIRYELVSFVFALLAWPGKMPARVVTFSALVLIGLQLILLRRFAAGVWVG